jgi:hypothetical protein
MAKRDSRGRFLKRGRSRRSTAIVRVPRTVTRTRTRYVKVRGRRRRAAGGGLGGPVLPLAIGAAALGFVSTKTSVLDVVDKVPGAKTVGRPAAVGLIALGINRFFFRNRWLKILGYVGVGIGAFQWGAKGFALEWLGDEIEVDD